MIKKLIVSTVVALGLAGAATADVFQVRNLMEVPVRVDTSDGTHGILPPFGIVNIHVSGNNYVYLNPDNLFGGDLVRNSSTGTTGKHAVYQIDVNGGFLYSNFTGHTFTDDITRTDWDIKTFNDNNTKWPIQGIWNNGKLIDGVIEDLARVFNVAKHHIDQRLDFKNIKIYVGSK